MKAETVEGPRSVGAGGRDARPGVLVAYAGGAPTLRAVPLPSSRRLVLGRESPDLPLEDDQVSRLHVEVSFDGAKWTVRDLGSRNGTFVDGARVDGAIMRDVVRVVRVGGTLVVPVRDASIYERAAVDLRGGRVVGPTLARALSQIEASGAVGEGTLLITGESGAGKEGAARAFHAAGPHAKGPLVVVNCAAIPKGLAETTLFGSKKGAYTGAANDAIGQVQAADKGVLFLDELGELDLEVQAKLLRLLETREIVPVGATTARKVDVKFCFATHRDLRSLAAANRFRHDLYYRIAQPHVRLPALRDRPEEIPWLVRHAVDRVDPALAISTGLVETCLARVWPGNVRELIAEVQRAARVAKGGSAIIVRAEHLDQNAGMPMEEVEERPSKRAAVTKESIEAALAESDGNISAAARAMGVHRTQFFRYMKRFRVSAGG